MRKLLLVAIFGGLAFGCSQDSPTSPSAPFVDLAPPAATETAFDVPTAEESESQLRALLDSMARQQRLTADEDFNCTAIDEVRARFSEPGFIDALDVGLFVKFVGVPAGTKTLRVWWDYENAFNVYQDITVGDGDTNPEDGTKFDIERVIEHTYSRADEYQVRVELILEDSTGNCARNREILVVDEPFEGFDYIASFSGVKACSVFGTFHSMGIGVKFTPPIPAGTTYTVRARVDASGYTGPPFVAAGFQNAVGTDIIILPPEFVPPPKDFVATFNTTGEHKELLIAGNVFGTAAHIRVLSIEIPGKTLDIVGTLAGTCP